MSDLVVIVPTRGRPEAAAELIDAFRATCTADTRLVFAIDGDDPTLDAYDALYVSSRFALTGWRAGFWTYAVVNGGTMVKALNEVAVGVLRWRTPPFAVGFMGDDHRPRTVGWDSNYLRTLRDLAAYRGAGIVYGDDTIQGQNLPTQVAMTSNVVQALGWMAPPVLSHMYVDNFWKDLGVAAKILRYLPETIVEHLHPIKTGVWTEGHERVSNLMGPDAVAYDRFTDVPDFIPGALTPFELAVAKVRDAVA